MNQSQNLVSFLAFPLSLSLIFYGTLAGDPTYYRFGSFVMLALTAYCFSTKSYGKSLILLAVVIFLSLRYIPIVKFKQPLYADSVHEFATATEFERNGRVDVIPITNSFFLRAREFMSGWPLIHLLAITIHKITGLPLFNVFTYFPPLVDLGSLLFIYLLANYIFKDPRIGGLSALIYATFNENMFWTGTQLIRQNIAYSLMLMAFYLYLRAKTDRKRKIMALSFFTFCILPIAHHLSSMEIFYIFLFGLFLELSLSFVKKVRATTFHTPTLKTSPSQPFNLILCLLVGSSMFLWWVTYAREIILPLFVVRVDSTLMNIVNMRLGGEVPKAVSISGSLFYMSMGVYDVLSYVRVLFLAIATLYGFSILAKEKNRHRFFLYVVTLAPLLLGLVGVFVDRKFDTRHFLFLLIPTFIVTAKTLRKFNRKILVLCLLIIIVPAPFELFDYPGDPTPTFIYDKSGTGNFVIGRDVIYRDDMVLSAAFHFASYTSDNLTADSYNALALLFHYDPFKILHPRYLLKFMSDPKSISEAQSTILVHRQFLSAKYFAGRERGLYEKYNVTMSIEELKDYANRLNNVTNRIYDNDEVVGWKSRP